MHINVTVMCYVAGMKQGSEGGHFYILMEGAAKATQMQAGRDAEKPGYGVRVFPTTLMRYYPGDYFGEIALLFNETRQVIINMYL